MLALLFAAAQAVAAPQAVSLATHPIENLALAEIVKDTVHIKFHTGGCDPKKVPVSYALRLRQSQVRETPPDLINQGAAVKRTIEVDYDVTALVTDATPSCTMAFDIENSTDLMPLARKNGDMDFAQPDTGFIVRFHLSNKIAGGTDLVNWPKK